MSSPPICTRALGLEVNYAGVSNQLIGLHNVLCMADAARACAVNLRPVGYASGALHAARAKDERPLPVTALLRFKPWAQSALELGPTLAESTEPAIQGKAPCQNASRSGRSCNVCHAYLSSPRGCVNNSFNRGATVWFDQAFNADPNKPRHGVRPCFGKDLAEIAGVAARVEAAAERLKRRLGLSDPYIAVQYRAGADWRNQDADLNTHACYGPATIDAALKAWAPLGAAPPMRFMLTNAHGYATADAHPQHPLPPAAERLVVEALVAKHPGVCTMWPLRRSAKRHRATRPPSWPSRTPLMPLPPRHPSSIHGAASDTPGGAHAGGTCGEAAPQPAEHDPVAHREAAPARGAPHPPHPPPLRRSREGCRRVHVQHHQRRQRYPAPAPPQVLLAPRRVCAARRGPALQVG